MASPLNAMELLQHYQAADQAMAARAQQMDQAQQINPLQVQAAQQNILANRMKMQRDEQQRNAMMQFGQTGNVNALAMADPRMAAQMQMQQNALAQKNALAREQMQMRYGNRPAARPQVIQGPDGPMQIDPTTNRAVPIVGPDGKPVGAKSTEKALPISAAQKLMENQQNLRRAEQAETLISGKNITDERGVTTAEGDKNATGWKGYLPDAVLQRLDVPGVATRAAIGDLGSLIIHDRSGAAVTASEFPRLRPFIPQTTDDPATVKKKLARFTAEYRNIAQETADFYKESGYKVPTGALRGANQAPAAGGAGKGWTIERVNQ